VGGTIYPLKFLSQNMDKLKKMELQLKDLSVHKDMIVVKTVSVFVNGKYIRDAQINTALLEQIKKGKISFNYNNQ
jgi:hypothetical protein